MTGRLGQLSGANSSQLSAARREMAAITVSTRSRGVPKREPQTNWQGERLLSAPTKDATHGRTASSLITAEAFASSIATPAFS
jgi:hypothetical protein